MNGRIYDPLLGRMLSADITVQAPADLQSFNRYTYVKNRPLSLVDPSGFFWQELGNWLQGEGWKKNEEVLKAAAPVTGEFADGTITLEPITVTAAAPQPPSGPVALSNGNTAQANSDGSLTITRPDGTSRTYTAEELAQIAAEIATRAAADRADAAANSGGHVSWRKGLVYAFMDESQPVVVMAGAFVLFIPVNLHARFREAAYEASGGDAQYADAQAGIMLGLTAEAGVAGVSALSRLLAAENIPAKLYHYTGEGNVGSILEKGLTPGRTGQVFTTTNGSLTPIQAQIELALSPNRGLPGALLEIDAAALQRAGIKPTFGPARVLPTGNAPGGGVEIIFGEQIPAEFIKRVR